MLINQGIQSRIRFRKAFLILTAFALTGASSFEAHAQAAFGVGSTQLDEGRAITTDSAGNTYLFGKFRLTADFDPGPGVFELTSALGSSNYVASYDAAGTLRYDFSIGPGL